MKTSVKKPMFMPSVLTGALLTAFSGSALANDQDEVVEMERMVVTASLTQHSELTAPASVSVITADDISKMPVKDISEAIRSATGVSVLSGTAYGRNNIRIRGLDSKHTLVLINGRRINSQDALIRGNDFDLSSIPLTAIQRIEVVRGPVSSLYGSEAMGGVVNVILKSPTEELSGSLGLEYESILEGDGGDGLKGHAYASGTLTENVEGSIIVESSARDPWRTDTNPDFDALEQKDTTNVFGELVWQLTEEQRLIADVIYTNDEREADWASHTNTQDSTRWNYGLTHEGAWDTVDSQVRLYGENMQLDDASTAYINGAADVELQNNTLDFKLSGLLRDSHEWVFGGEYRTSELKNSRDVPSGDIDNYQGAVFVQGEFDLNKLAVTLGGRQDFHEVYGSHFSPRAYAVYSLTDEFVLKGGFGGGFRAPGMMESSDQVRVISCRGGCWLTGNEDLKPEESESYEAGLAYETTAMGVGLMYYHTDLKNKIERDLTKPVGSVGQTSIFTYQNIGKAETKGFELEGWYDITDSINLKGNYTYTDARDKSSGDKLTKTPEHLANLDVNWEVFDSFTTFARVNYIGKQVITNQRRENKTVDGYTLVGLGVAYDFQQFNLKAGLNNIFDVELDDEDDYYGYSEKGRSAYVSATYLF
ncbi:TonB-dependent receptor domain-containing protein [Vibrio campbellii]|nr:TonB-dependent receptor [Vibrio campbellii]AGU96445.1 colicin I receptor [Vibrio campbellii ATCC BAA-1116]MBT0122110.1 TonB-dependent receptor [Vibrio campbellii]MBT0136889.1 TonB-dependent receptor [Vibrio campbellii]MBT0141767.1 TonB-dependent receptor [Vibrio campbellii]MBT0146356.1 TonB-dependent receptor [Vibrio campbellii]